MVPLRGNETGIVAFNSRDVVSVRVYHGGAVDGIRFYLRGPVRGSGSGGGAPAIPPRTYLDTTSGTFSALPTDGPQRGNSLLFGKRRQTLPMLFYEQMRFSLALM